MKASTTTRWLSRSVVGVVGVLTIIGVVVVIRRILTLTGVIAPYVHPQFGTFDGGFAQYPVLTFIHIVPGALFLLFTPLQFVPPFRARYRWFHRWLGWMLVMLGGIIGSTALVMSFRTRIGGANETVATVIFALVFLFALGKAVYHVRQREIVLHREWMLRMFAIGLAVATVRPLVGLFFAFTSLAPQEFFGIAFWLGFTLHLLAAEGWINHTRPKRHGVTPNHFS